MLTPALVELVCTIFEDTYGRVGAQVMRALLLQGQLALADIVRETGFPASTVRRSLVSMITNRFVLFWQQSPRVLYYGNWKQVYQILWSGQLLAENECAKDLRACLLNGYVRENQISGLAITEKFVVPAREWQFWPEEELEQSVHLQKTREVANNIDSMGKSENAQRQQADVETQAELDRIRSQIYVSSKAPGDDGLYYTINWDKFLVQSRRRELTEFAAQQVGAITAKVYGIVLRLSEASVKSIKERRVPSTDLAVTTQSIVSLVDEGLVQEMAKAFLSDPEEDSPRAKKLKTNGGKSVAVRNFKPAELVNKHLEYLMECRSASFIQKLGTRQGGEWFVPFEKVNIDLKQSIFDETVTQSFGEPASRLIGLIRQRGKLDEKSLGAFALLANSEIRHQMSALSSYGFADIQELANERSGSNASVGAQKRSIFLWYHRPEWAYARLLDLIYVQITDCIKQSQDLRRDHRILLTKLSREDVKSNINQYLTAKELEELEQFRATERDIFKKMNMLDRNVRIFREY